MGLLRVRPACAAVSQAAVEGVKVHPDLGQLARHVGQDLLADPARLQDGRETIVASREEVEHQPEER